MLYNSETGGISAGAEIDEERNKLDCLVVDEAHRLNAKSGMFQNKGENQIKEIINASKFSIFFIDENQKVTLNDIGSEELIKKFGSAKKIKEASVQEIAEIVPLNVAENLKKYLDKNL